MARGNVLQAQHMAVTAGDTETTPFPAQAGIPRLPFPVVGMGASAGGLAALRRFFEHLPSDAGMAFVVVLHLSARHESNADKVLQRCTRMPVKQVTGSLPIQANHVYVISPRHNLAMTDGHLHVSPGMRPRGAPVAIDLFLRTLAQAHRERAIAIVLSGAGSDGTAGIAGIKETGGVTIAQLPEDSEYEDMPRNAIASGNVDFVLPVADMPQTLLDIWRNARDIALPAPGPSELPLPVKLQAGPETEAALREILAMLTERTGHDFSHYKRATMLRRMERRLQVRMLKDLPSYRDHLRQNPGETPQLLADMLISVTHFFRDREAFEALERDVVPGLFDRLAQADAGPPDAAAAQAAAQAHDRDRGTSRTAGRLRVWVPGCATGEEAYSLAMLLHEEAQRRGLAPDCQVFATDIDEAAIAVARRGRYPQSILTDVAPTRLREFFSAGEDHYQIRKFLRERLLFTAHNALRDPPFSQLDLISCRNLLIYLNRDIQEKLLEMFHFALRPGGVLFLGSSETADAADGLFEPIDKKNRIYRARPSVAGQRRTPSVPLRINTKAPAAAMVRARGEPRRSFAELHQRVLEQYAPPSVIVDADGTIVHMTEHAGQYLQHRAGVPSHNLVALVHPALRLELRTALFQAGQTRASVEARRACLQRGERSTYINMIVRPFSDTDAGQGGADFMLVLFEEVEQTMSAEPVEAGGPADAIAEQLERELQRTREQLQSTIEQSNLSAEELRASNEELQAINEELRSTTEELETSTEELQSVNEELVTVNAELKAKVEETEQVNDDLKNFIASTDIATVFIDSELRIRRYTPPAESIFSLIASDIGRGLFDISNRLRYPSLREDIATVVESLQTVEREVRSDNGRWFICRIHPYQTLSRRIDGVVLTFVDISRLREAQERLERGEEDMRLALLQSSDFAVVATDPQGYIIGWNSGAKAIFGYTDAEMSGKKIHSLFVPEDVAAGVPEKEMENARLQGRASDERWHLRKDGSRVFCSGVMTPVDVEGLRGYVKIARDATRQREMRQLSEQQLTRARAAHADAKATIALREEFLAVMSHELKHPLNLISVNAELIGRVLVDELGREPTAARALDAICRAVRGQSRIVDDLLDLSRIRTGKLSLDLVPVDLVATSRAAVESMEADAAACQVRLQMEPAESPVLVCADVARLNQILWNLIGNALKFTPAGGVVEVKVCAEAGFGRLDVIDNGQGIDPLALPRIFEMFGQAGARAASHQSGLGIGLSVVRQVAEHHGGRVQGESLGLGKGSRFSVWLPLHTALPTAKAGRGKRALRCTGLRLLVVDDDPGTVEALAILLRLEGAHVLAANTGEQALELAANQPLDLVLTDLGMPGMDGYQLLARLRERPASAALPVIAVTGFGRENDARRTNEAGFAAHIGKPVQMAELLRQIQAVLRPGAAIGAGTPSSDTSSSDTPSSDTPSRDPPPAETAGNAGPTDHE